MSRQNRPTDLSAQLNALSAQLQQLEEQLERVGAGPASTSRTRSGNVAETAARSTQTGVSRLTVAPQLCRGCGLCVRIAPRTFAIDAQTRKVVVKDQGGDQADLIEMAMARCPTGAIRYG